MTDSRPFVFRWGDERALAAVGDHGGSGATVTLHEGPDERWLRLDSPERFADWTGMVVGRLGDCRSWTTIAAMNRWPVERYASIPRRLATGRLLRCLDHQLAGHALAAARIHERLPDAVVRLGLVPDDDYELHDLLLDTLAAPAGGVTRTEIGPHLRARRAAFVRAHPARGVRRSLRRRLVASAIPLDQALPRAIGAVYATAREAA